MVDGKDAQNCRCEGIECNRVYLDQVWVLDLNKPSRWNEDCDKWTNEGRQETSIVTDHTSQLILKPFRIQNHEQFSDKLESQAQSCDQGIFNQDVEQVVFGVKSGPDEITTG